MREPVAIAAVGTVVLRPGREEDSGDFGRRLAGATAAAPAGGRPVRLINRVEEVAVVAAHDALGGAARADGGRLGLALGLDEGIDGIKARHFEAVRAEGPLGASPLHFPFTAPNAVAAQVAIAFGIRGESVTYCGGTLSGAQALAHARDALLAGLQDEMLAGGATSVEREYLEGLSRAGFPDAAEIIDGACLFLLRRHPPGAATGPLLLGVGGACGPDDVADAVRAALDDASRPPREIGAVWIVAPREESRVADAVRRAGFAGPVHSSPWSGFQAASFPLAAAGALERATTDAAAPLLVVGTDCLCGAAAALFRPTPAPNGRIST